VCELLKRTTKHEYEKDFRLDPAEAAETYANELAAHE
jgi:hypothetical protein